MAENARDQEKRPSKARGNKYHKWRMKLLEQEYTPFHFNCTIKLQIDTINPFLDKRMREEERGEWQRLFQTAA